MVHMVTNYQTVARRPGRLPDFARRAVLTSFDAVSTMSADLVPGGVRTTLAAVGMSLQQLQARGTQSRQAVGRTSHLMAERGRAQAPDDRAPGSRGR